MRWCPRAELTDVPRRRIWLLSAYRADSHAAWGDWLVEHLSEFDWTTIELPGRHFAWRIRGNPLSWLDSLPEDPPDGILATSMVDLATLKGLNPRLADVPTLYYFHENQFAYPHNDGQTTSLDAQMVQLYGALAANRVLFNSRYNRESLLAGVETLLQRLPDRVPAGIVDRLEARSNVLPVPIDPIASRTDRDEGLILWNHRWEYDKRPDRFASAMIELAERGVDFRLALLGPRPKQPPEPLLRLRRKLPGRIVADGRLDAREYRDTVARAGIAVSTSNHEFQGISVLEAASAGARPLVPDALCYPELYPARCRYPKGDMDAFTERLASWLAGKRPPAVDVTPWSRERLAPRWRAALATLID
jgi:glycosyltransferase involved in cell wall biosynthesis